MKIAVVDYGLANLRSVLNAFACFGVDVELADDGEKLRQADKIVLPGVGSFDAAMTALHRRGLVEALDETVRKGGKPFLGICLGQQLICDSSEEGTLPGLGWLPGQVRKFPAGPGTPKVPHIGWNEVRLVEGRNLHGLLGASADFYFVHSYYLPNEGRIAEAATGLCDYGVGFAAAVAFDNIAAVQFHPEKSQLAGMKLLENFVAG